MSVQDALHGSTHAILLIVLGLTSLTLYGPDLILAWNVSPQHRGDLPHIGADAFRRFRVLLTVATLIPFAWAPMIVFFPSSFSTTMRRIFVFVQLCGCTCADILLQGSKSPGEYSDVLMLYVVVINKLPEETLGACFAHAVLLGVSMAFGWVSSLDRDRVVYAVALRTFLLICAVWVTPSPPHSPQSTTSTVPVKIQQK
eukprot:PhF_6_TR864/c0_g1_i1/m.1302